MRAPQRAQLLSGVASFCWCGRMRCALPGHAAIGDAGAAAGAAAEQWDPFHMLVRPGGRAPCVIPSHAALPIQRLVRIALERTRLPSAWIHSRSMRLWQECR